MKIEPGEPVEVIIYIEPGEPGQVLIYDEMGVPQWVFPSFPNTGASDGPKPFLQNGDFSVRFTGAGYGSHSSVGRALDCGSRCHGFDPR